MQLRMRNAVSVFYMGTFKYYPPTPSNINLDMQIGAGLPSLVQVRSHLHKLNFQMAGRTMQAIVPPPCIGCR